MTRVGRASRGRAARAGGVASVCRAWRGCAALALVAIALPAQAQARARGEVTMSGSTSTRPVLADLAYFYRRATPEAPRFTLAGGGTTIGITDAARGIVDAGMVSRNLGPGDPPGLVLTPLALSGVCLVTNAANPVSGLTRAQVQDLVAGRVTSWTQIPGSTRMDAIVSVALDLTAGARQVFESVFVDVTTRITYAPRTFATAAQVRDFVEQTPAALGYVDLAYTTTLHTLTYDGVACTRKNLLNATYPAQRPLGVVTKGKPRGAVARFLRWVATSRKARQVIATRYVPRD
jgi:phosphate transport system substrate-binding protein